jgi:hypothetical protein
VSGKANDVIEKPEGQESKTIRRKRRQPNRSLEIEISP